MVWSERSSSEFNRTFYGYRAFVRWRCLVRYRAVGGVTYLRIGRCGGELQMKTIGKARLRLENLGGNARLVSPGKFGCRRVADQHAVSATSRGIVRVAIELVLDNRVVG